MKGGPSTTRWRTAALACAAWSALLACGQSALAQTRVTGLDVSYYQGDLSPANWNTIHTTDGRAFTFIRASRGGTTGTYNPSNTSLDTLARRYDDPYFVQNITNATDAGMFAGPYHFGRPDIIASSPNSGGIANTGTDEANHMIEAAGAWMRPGYLVPIFDFEAGATQRTPSELAQFAIDFSDRIYAVKGIRPGVYIGNNYSDPMDSIPESAALVAAYPTLWNPRWPNQSNPNSINIQGTDPGDYTSTIYGPWDNPPNPADPWHFWQYTSNGRLQGIANASAAVDLDVAHGGIEYVKDHLVPAMWTNNSSGDWTTLDNWNSGLAPTPPVTGPGQLPPTSTALPAARLPGPNDTVVLDRSAANITVTLASGTQSIRKLYVREALNITGGALNIGYVPSADSTPIAAQFSDAVSLSGSGSLRVHTLQVDAARTFTLGGGVLTFNTINLMPSSVSPARIAMTGDVDFVPLSNATATIAKGAGSGASGGIDLNGASRAFNVSNGPSSIDLAINVPVTNGGLTKTGLGTLALNGANSYAGDTAVQAGTLSLGSAMLADTSNIYLTSGATLEMNFTGNADYVHGLYFDGIGQPYGVWGPIGSGAQYTTAFLTGSGRLSVTPFPPPAPPPGHIIDDFEVDQGHFNWPYNYAPASQTFGLSATTAISRVTTQHQGTGTGSQLLDLVASGPGAWQIAHDSGIGAAAQPSGNEPLDATGYVGFWLKTDHAGVTVRIGIDDPTATYPNALERGFAQSVIGDNEWHLYQWNLDDANHWDPFADGANGAVDATSGFVTIDSIWFSGAGNAQIYLDNVSHNPLGLLAAGYVLGDYNGDGAVTSSDYTAWRKAFGTTVTPGTKADGDHDGYIGAGDYLIWRMQMTLIAASGGSSSFAFRAEAVPEPTTAILAIILAAAAITTRRPSLAA